MQFIPFKGLTKAMAGKCRRCDELSTAVDGVLEKLVSLTNEQVRAFRLRDDSYFMRIDKELELTLGLKERSIGALREHRREHESALQSKAS